MNPEGIPEQLGWIFGRRSVRAYGPGAIGDDQVEILLRAAMAAPSAVAKDPWRFVVVRDRSLLARLAGNLSNGSMLDQAPLGIVVAGDLHAAHDRQLSYLLQDCAAAIENLLLSAHGLGLGACWLGIHPRQHRIDFVTNLLCLPEAVIPVACIALGQPAETKEPRSRFNPAWVHRDRW
ncbi:MAG: nitroreductase family protein [Verrucomicrobiales bacterium]|nr:nitroreductase family protein [Verrucomicrobiales bacterium]MCP5526396.1 nitroreductase family protein [Verrucomicrobiales bacterium]